MTRKPSVLSPEDNLEKARVIFERHGFHHIPVVEDGKLSGLVSYTDYLRIIRDLFSSDAEQRRNETQLHTILIKDIMTRHLVCLAPTDTVEDALRVFKSNQFHAIPVVEGEKRLVGILSTYDLIKVLERILAPDIDYAS